MDFKEALLHYYPYWILGICMFFATYFSDYKDLLEFKPKSFLLFAKKMMLITAIRCLIMHFFPPSHASVVPVLQIPLWLTATVGWEDMCFTMPIAIAARFLGDGKFAKIAQKTLLGLMMISFFTGHVYQGYLSAALISLYIPIVSELGKKHGFRTVAACHILYDFLTLLAIRLFVG